MRKNQNKERTQLRGKDKRQVVKMYIRILPDDDADEFFVNDL